MLQARVVHNLGHEWTQIKEAAEKARQTAIMEGDEVAEMTCSELLEALDLSRCLLLMKYVEDFNVCHDARNTLICFTLVSIVEILSSDILCLEMLNKAQKFSAFSILNLVLANTPSDD